MFNFKGMRRYWFDDNVVLTHALNAAGLVFPAGERFFMRSVAHYRDQVKDAAILRDVNGFFAQEATHARAHENSFEALEAEGFETRPYLDWYEAFAYKRLAGAQSPAVRLATTPALEHYTALLGEAAMATTFCDGADPAMRSLLLWHAAEEIEHRSVAYDVLQIVNPKYRLRLIGFVIGSTTLGFFIGAAFIHLLRQEHVGLRRMLTDAFRAIPKLGIMNIAILKGAYAYLLPGFHPADRNLDELVASQLDALGLG